MKKSETYAFANNAPTVYKCLVPQACSMCNGTIAVGELFTRSAKPNMPTKSGIKYCLCIRCVPIIFYHTMYD